MKYRKLWRQQLLSNTGMAGVRKHKHVSNNTESHDADAKLGKSVLFIAQAWKNQKSEAPNYTMGRCVGKA